MFIFLRSVNDFSVDCSDITKICIKQSHSHVDNAILFKFNHWKDESNSICEWDIHWNVDDSMLNRFKNLLSLYLYVIRSLIFLIGSLIEIGKNVFLLTLPQMRFANGSEFTRKRSFHANAFLLRTHDDPMKKTNECAKNYSIYLRLCSFQLQKNRSKLIKQCCSNEWIATIISGHCEIAAPLKLFACMSSKVQKLFALLSKFSSNSEIMDTIKIFTRKLSHNFVLKKLCHNIYNDRVVQMFQMFRKIVYGINVLTFA